MACLIETGCCGTYYSGLRTVIFEPSEYYFKKDGCRSRDLYREWAADALREESNECGQVIGGPDYAEGFEEGFVEYIYAGGSGEPPPVPPRKYWNVALRSGAGKERANQWFNGYRNGARIAANRGYRAAGVIPTSVVSDVNPYASQGFRQPIQSDLPSGTEALPSPPTANPFKGSSPPKATVEPGSTPDLTTRSNDDPEAAVPDKLSADVQAADVKPPLSEDVKGVTEADGIPVPAELVLPSTTTQLIPTQPKAPPSVQTPQGDSLSDPSSKSSSSGSPPDSPTQAAVKPMSVVTHAESERISADIQSPSPLLLAPADDSDSQSVPANLVDHQAPCQPNVGPGAKIVGGGNDDSPASNKSTITTRAAKLFTK
jgi:hypothetical protein